MDVKSLAGKIAGAVLEPLLPLIRPFVKGVIINYLLDPLLTNDKQLHDTVVTTLYGPIDVYVEGEAEKTSTKVDDFAVDVVLESLEDSAKKSGIELPNLDND